MTSHRPRIGRRAFLVGAGAATLAACSSDGVASPVVDSTATGSGTPSTGPAAIPTSTDPTTPVPSSTEPGENDSAGAGEPPPLSPDRFDALAVCALLPESAAGPFPTIEQLDRRDVTEGYPGHPLRLGLRVVDSACNPLQGAAVEIWHADASGDYSSYADNGSGKDEAEGTTFLRGFQVSDVDGIVDFQTIYPGWYSGRAVHIHTRVRRENAELLTAQLYFDEKYTAQIYTAAPYDEFGQSDTSWASDRLAEDPATDGTGISLAAGPTWNGDGTVGLVNMGVRT